MSGHVTIQKGFALKSLATFAQRTFVTLTMNTSGMKPLFGLVFKMKATAVMTSSADFAFMHGKDVTVQVTPTICGIVAVRVMT